MGRRILILVVIIVLVVSGYYAYKNYQGRRFQENGAVHCEGCLSPAEEEAFKRENAGETPDGQSEHKDLSHRYYGVGSDDTFFRRKSDEIKPDQSWPDQHRTDQPYPGQSSPGQSSPSQTYSGQNSPNPAYPTRSGYDQSAGAYPPAHDSIAPNPPNGMSFSGRGQYQWYREGNLTWRLNTETGTSCVAYATLAEWRKPLVSSHGCGNQS